jgi:hypothetical protein
LDEEHRWFRHDFKGASVKYAIAAVLFLAGALTSSAFEWLHEITTIEMTNVSDQPIRYIDIRYRGQDEMQGRIAQGLKPNEKITFKWVTVSEASFEYMVTFEDGHQLARTGEYTSRGQTVKDEIGADSITGATTDMLYRSTTRKVTRTPD